MGQEVGKSSGFEGEKFMIYLTGKQHSTNTPFANSIKHKAQATSIQPQSTLADCSPPPQASPQL